MFDLAFVWAALIAFAVLAYVLFDGFDLGIGILFPRLAAGAERDQAMNSVAPVWDGNETWLVLGGGGLMAAFPLAYAVVLPALYAPITGMLLGLIFRGVAFEFRFRSTRRKLLWDGAFAAGSTLAAFAQGVALGALVQGIPVAGRAYAGGWWDWLSWFSLLTGLALVVGYALLGATWLVWKTNGPVQQKAYAAAWVTGLGTLALIGLVSVIMPFLDPLFRQRWFSWPNMVYAAPVPILVALAAALLLVGLSRQWQRAPFLAAVLLFVLSYIGLGINFYPYILPPSLTIWEAAAPAASLQFLLVGALVLIPLILCYTAWAYWVFRGKVSATGGYH
ncbi:MAG TPA: cytochrome d ubiquinol oxidase subunit II [Hyphomicrobiaceae bacterium]|nr:cytochrome d ubiquinol oxidase subunit II [Hyphomicrobiaceae bacterium]